MKDDSVPIIAPPPRNVQRILKIVGWNLLFILSGLSLIWIMGEAYWRLNGRFGYVSIDLGSDPAYWRFVPGVGLLRPPQSEIAFSNGLNYWRVQRSNSLGFMDREPIDPEHAAESCHITIIGDSYVEAKEVPVSDKLQVRLEELATREKPNLDVTTSAFGIQRTGVVNQLPFYDGYARDMSPDLVVLVFVRNDLVDNSTARYALMPRHVPDRMPYGQAAKGSDGDVRWLPPRADFDDAPPFSHDVEALNSWSNRAIYRLARASYFMRWLGIRSKLIGGGDWVYERFRPSQDSIGRYQEWIHLEKRLDLPGGRMTTGDVITAGDDFTTWGFTSWGLEQFKRRADHDGAALIVLASYSAGGRWDPSFELLSDIAESLDIPVVSQKDYIISQGRRVEEAHWGELDNHWTPAGHQWSAEAIWEYIKEEWEGKCPGAEPQPDIMVDWIAVGETLNELEYEDTIQTFSKSFGLRHRIHTPEGVAWVQSFPVLDSEKHQSVYESITSRRPTVRSNWDVHIYDDGITYLKEQCDIEDANAIFFLHVTPEYKNDLPSDRQSVGFENLDFYFGLRGMAFDGHCMVSANLPEYEIESINTGQVAKNWSAHYNFASSEIIDAVQEIRLSDRQPDIRSNFDIYLDDSRIIYVKDSCGADDRETPFFLHVFPADENNLTDEREESGFENLDFDLMQNGGESDGACFAAVDLPDYEIDSIRTGQFVRGEGNVWETSIEFAE